MASKDSFKSKSTLAAGGKSYTYFSLEAAAKKAGLGDIARLPASLKVLLENMLRFEDGLTVTRTTSRRSANGLTRAARTRARSPTARPAC
jgi:aconitate hydratase